MAYKEALEAAGATVQIFKEFGSYQGVWWARVTYKGQPGWVSGWYGSCSGCDAFEGEFGWSLDRRCDEHTYDGDSAETCEACKLADISYQARLINFGLGYLDRFAYTQEEAEIEASKSIDWDGDEMLQFIREHSYLV